MSSEERRRAEEALHDLESRWISLLTWLARKQEVSEDDLVANWHSDTHLAARDKLDRDSRRIPEGQVRWTVLNYLDFGRYLELATFYRDKLEALGNPPRNWRSTLDDLNSRGCIRYRNHLAHGDRFDQLPREEQAEAVQLFRAQRDLLRNWWPEVPRRAAPMPTEDPRRVAVRLLSSDPESAGALVAELGMQPIQAPSNLLPEDLATPLSEALEAEFEGLYRVGQADLGGVNAAVYLAYIREWHRRSSQREKHRRKLAKALIEHQVQDPRWLAVLMDATGKSREAEFLVPRQRTAKPDERRKAFATVRALVNLDEPNKHHVELLEDLKVPADATLPELSRQWNEALSVEAVTKRFYEEFALLRNRIVKALVENNPGNEALAGRDPETDLQLLAFGTRQLGRILFLWFIQQKRWLGGNAGSGRTDFLLHHFHEHQGDDASFYNDVLLPIFFEGLGSRLQDPKHRAVEDQFGPIPFLGGGLFRLGADDFEAALFGVTDEGERTVRVNIPDDLFDPRADRPSENARPSPERTVLGLLRGYRFTTQESTPDDQSLDPDPELLGKVFENLYQKKDRHDTGAYYTPREIVHYMCRQALDGYLRSRTGVDQATLDWLREEALDWAVSNVRLSDAEYDALDVALDRVRIVDPAVGSGAFLVASLQEIVLLRRGIEQSRADRDFAPNSAQTAEWKRRTITESLYGVDINPMAVEICHLRLWLSLIVELDVDNYREITALPNLDLRVVAGDSLIDRMGEEPFIHSLPTPPEETFDMFLRQKVAALQDRVGLLQLRFANEGDSERDRLRLVKMRKEIRRKQMEIAQAQLEEAIKHAEERVANLPAIATQRVQKKAAERLEHLRNLRDGLRDDAPFQKPFLWPVNFHEIFDQGGFDIVVANPPYVQAGVLDAADRDIYGYSFPDVHSSASDLYAYFYNRAYQLLRPGGFAAIISSNKFMRADYGVGLRSFLANRWTLQQVIDFAHLPVFDADVMPVVVLMQSLVPSSESLLTFARLREPIRISIAMARRPMNVASTRDELQGLIELIERFGIDDVPQSELAQGVWAPVNRHLADVRHRVENKCSNVRAVVGSVASTYGIKTGFNRAYVIDDAVREQLCREPSSSALLKRWARGQDISRWRVNWAGLWLIWLPSSTEETSMPWWAAASEQEAEQIFSSAFPAVYDHMKRFEPELRKRSDQGKFWWELRSCTYYDALEAPKIVWQDIGYSPQFALDNEGLYFGNTAFFFPGAPSWAVSVFNSIPFTWLASMNLFEAKDAYYRWLPGDMAEIPVPNPGEEAAVELSRLARDASRGDSIAEFESRINELCFSIYRLDAEARSAIESWWNLRVRAETITSILQSANDD